MSGWDQQYDIETIGERMSNHASRSRRQHYGVWRKVDDPPRPHRRSRGKGFHPTRVTAPDSAARVVAGVENLTARIRERFKHFLKSTREDDDG